MKPKYSIGEIVRIKATGEKVKIIEVAEFDKNCYETSDGYIYHESELKPYRPSRTGIRAKNGRFISQKSLIEMVTCNQCDKKFETVNEYEQHAYHVHLYPDSKQRNYQKIEKLNIVYDWMKYPLEQSIVNKINEIIDELGRRV